jgi:hypothetical protein
LGLIREKKGKSNSGIFSYISFHFPEARLSPYFFIIFIWSGLQEKKEIIRKEQWLNDFHRSLSHCGSTGKEGTSGSRLHNLGS